MSDHELISTHAERLRVSGVLGRSTVIQRLFDYLVDCSLKGKVPKEIELAVDGLGKGANFDVSQDAMVRVYVHKLRRKLDEFYAGPGRDLTERIAIPKGEYRLAIGRVEPAESAAPVEAMPSIAASGSRIFSVGAVAVILLLSIAVAWLLLDRYRATDDELAAVRQTQIWSPILSDGLPIYLVMGDYYIFGERDSAGMVRRLVRDFDVNSRDDFERYLQQHPAAVDRYLNMDLAYLPVGAAGALRNLMPILAPANDRVHVVMSSAFDPALFKSAHVIYIGYLSGLGMLSEIVFAGSSFAVGSSFDELVEMDTGKRYMSGAGDPERGTHRYRDYAYVSAFPGPHGTQNLIVAATRDTALMHSAETLANAAHLNEVASAAKSTALEAVYEVVGVSQTNIEGKLVAVRPLDVANIWSGASEDGAGSDDNSSR